MRQVAKGFKDYVRTAYGRAISGGGDGGDGVAGGATTNGIFLSSLASAGMAADEGRGEGGSNDNVREVVAKEEGNGMDHPSQQLGGQFPSLAVVPLAARLLLFFSSHRCRAIMNLVFSQ